MHLDHLLAAMNTSIGGAANRQVRTKITGAKNRELAAHDHQTQVVDSRPSRNKILDCPDNGKKRFSGTQIRSSADLIYQPLNAKLFVFLITALDQSIGVALVLRGT